VPTEREWEWNGGWLELQEFFEPITQTPGSIPGPAVLSGHRPAGAQNDAWYKDFWQTCSLFIFLPSGGSQRTWRVWMRRGPSAKSPIHRFLSCCQRTHERKTNWNTSRPTGFKWCHTCSRTKLITLIMYVNEMHEICYDLFGPFLKSGRKLDNSDSSWLHIFNIEGFN